MLRRLAEAGVPEVVEVGGRLEAWEAAIARFANGNGDGNEAAKAAVDAADGVQPPQNVRIVFEHANA